MRRQLHKFLPIVLIALVVQVLAPIAASWAAAATASDPLQVATICHSAPGGSGQTDPGSDPHAHDGACLICCAAQLGGALDTPPQTAVPAPTRLSTRVIWQMALADAAPPRIGSNSQARAPPQQT